MEPMPAVIGQERGYTQVRNYTEYDLSLADSRYYSSRINKNSFGEEILL